MNVSDIERPGTEELDAMPTIIEGQADDLKMDDGGTRWWLGRCGIADGMPFENTVEVEVYLEGGWTSVLIYDGDNPDDTIEV